MISSIPALLEGKNSVKRYRTVISSKSFINKSRSMFLIKDESGLPGN